jgi:hypothetical protein
MSFSRSFSPVCEISTANLRNSAQHAANVERRNHLVSAMAAQRGDHLRKNSFLNYKSAALPTELCPSLPVAELTNTHGLPA